MTPARSLFAAAALLLPLALACAAGEARAVPHVDAQRFAGTWYELARVPDERDADCASDITTRYAPRTDGTMEVTTTCRTPTGKLDTSTGRAWAPDPRQRGNVARIELSTMPKGLRWLPLRRSEWRVVMLDAHYRIAVLSEPSRQHLRVLSRSPTLPADLLGRIVDRLRADGYPTGQLVLTRQDSVGKLPHPPTLQA